MLQQPQAAIVLIAGSGIERQNRAGRTNRRQNTPVAEQAASVKSLGASYGSPQEENL